METAKSYQAIWMTKLVYYTKYSLGTQIPARYVTVATILYRKIPKFSDTKIFAVSFLKFKQRGQSLGYFVKMVQRE